MKNIFLILISLISFSLYSQIEKVKGKWILDFVTYENGEQLEIQNNLYSTFKSLEISDDIVIINLININKAQLFNNRISMKYIKYNYHFDNKYLVVKEDKDNKLYYYLKVIDFRLKYPDSRAEKIEYAGKDVLKYNQLLNIDIVNSNNFDSIAFFRKSIKSYNKHIFSNKIFKATYILTSDNKIENVKIEKSISDKFDEDFIKASQNLSKLYKNKTGLDILMEYNDYLGKYVPKRTEAQKEFYTNMLIANYYYQNEQYNLAKEIYSILFNSRDVLHFTDYHLINDIYKKLIVSLIYTHNIVDACLMLNDIKDINYFEVRNYLREYCPN